MTLLHHFPGVRLPAQIHLSDDTASAYHNNTAVAILIPNLGSKCAFAECEVDLLQEILARHKLTVNLTTKLCSCHDMLTPDAQ